MKNYCFLCGQQVLGLKGQDLSLDTAYLIPQYKQQIISANAWGSCHIECLVNSSYGSIWSLNNIRFCTEALGYRVIDKIERYVCMRHPKSGVLWIVRDDGWQLSLSSFSKHTMISLALEHDGYYILFDDLLYIDFDQDFVFYEEVKNNLDVGAKFSLSHIINKLGLNNRLIFDFALSESFVTRQTEAKDAHGNYYLAVGEDSLVLYVSATYRVFCPSTVSLPNLLKHKR